MVVAATLLFSLLPQPDRFKAPGLLLEATSHPRLFAELKAIATALDEPFPRQVYLVGQVNAFVADRGGIMGFGSRRVMGIGLPLLSSLTISEIRAVLAHEFAHYYSGDTKLGPWVCKTQCALIRIFQNVGSVGRAARFAVLQLMNLVATFILKWYFIFFMRVVNFVSRRQEYCADELACLVAGAEPLIQGLRKIHSAALAWAPYWNSEVVPVLNQGCKPGIADGFSRFLAAPQIEVQVNEGIEKEIAEGRTEPYDTHPPLRDRIAAIKKLNAEPIENNKELAISLLDQLEMTELQLLGLANPKLVKNALRHVGWDEIGRTVTIPAWKALVREFSPLVEGVTARAIPNIVKKLPQIVLTLYDPSGLLLTVQERVEKAGQVIGMALGLTLLENGWELEAWPGSFYLHRGEERINVSSLMTELVSGQISAEAWAARCDELGIGDLRLDFAIGDAAGGGQAAGLTG
ncbi:MAG: M48 family metallopeptidase [Candidatus Acidiferrum sp.]